MTGLEEQTYYFTGLCWDCYFVNTAYAFELSENCHRLCIAKRELLIEVVAFEVEELS